MGTTKAASLRDALLYSNVVFAGTTLVWLMNAIASVIRGIGNMFPDQSAHGQVDSLNAIAKTVRVRHPIRLEPGSGFREDAERRMEKSEASLT
jgi:hypothetical protein